MDEQRTLKIILLGHTNTGKTTLITSFLYGYPIIPKKPVLFGAFYKEIMIDDREYKINVCDTSGSTEFLRLQEISFLDAHLIVLCVDSSDRTSLADSEEWIKHFKGVNIPIVLCLTKCDLPRGISSSDIDRYINKYRIDGYVETDGNDNRKVRQCFKKMILMAEKGKNMNVRFCWNIFKCC